MPRETKVVAEVGLSHEGSLGQALALVDACAEAGVDFVKFQYRRAAWDFVPEFRDASAFPQDAFRAKYWHRTGFTHDQWRAIAQRCLTRSVGFASSVFSWQSLDALAQALGDRWDAIKIPSPCLGDRELLKEAGGTGMPVWLSTGLSTAAEVQRAICTLVTARERSDEFGWLTVLQCTSVYPTHVADFGLNVIGDLGGASSTKPGWLQVGLSDHSGTMWPAIAAATIGADLVEVHVCTHRAAFGPDTAVSVTIDELGQLCEGVRAINEMRANPVDKSVLTPGQRENRAIYCQPTERTRTT